MTPQQARDLQREMEKLAIVTRNRHIEERDVRMICLTLAEILAFLAARMEARSRVPNKRG